MDTKEKRLKPTGMRWTPRELRMIDGAAGLLGITRTEFVRRATHKALADLPRVLDSAALEQAGKA